MSIVGVWDKRAHRAKPVKLTCAQLHIMVSFTAHQYGPLIGTSAINKIGVSVSMPPGGMMSFVFNDM